MERQPINTWKRALPMFAWLCAALMFSACQKETELTVPVEEASPALSNAAKNATTNEGTTVTEITFTATALIDHCFGENILFTGIIENRVHTATTSSGSNHYSRHFTVKGMTGTGLETGTIFDVVGGSEMFSIKDAVFNADGSLNLAGSLSESDIVIHRGILVFVSRTDGTRVVARHDIQKVPGAGLLQNRWLCGGN